MKVLGYIFLGLCLISLGVLFVRLGWYDGLVRLMKGITK